MSQIHDEGQMTFPSGAALSANRRVKLASGVLQYCGSTDIGLGTLEFDTVADTNMASGYSDGTVRLWVADSTHKFVASEAITAANTFYGASNGKVAASGTITVGVALETVTTDGDYLEGMSLGNADVSGAVGGTTAAAFLVDSDATTPKIELSGQSGGTGNFKTTLKPESTLSGNNTIIVPEADGDTLAAVALAQTMTNKTFTSPIVNLPTGTRLVTTDADNRTVTAAESGSTFCSTGSGGAGTFDLPAATKGLTYTFHVDAAQELRINPDGSETIGLPSTGVQGAAGKYLTANAVGEWVRLICVVAGVWTVEGYAGTWTAET